ncbi:MAG: hypothetical protein OEY20_16615 [Gemmatimonadota bacterium]|nr:hypothetical protein [Gemmatimonadota bacterium]
MNHNPTSIDPLLDGLPGSAPRPVAWARPWSVTAPLARKSLRAGAWYPVLEDRRAEGTVILVMRHRHVRVPARLLEVRRDRPHRFTVVRLTPGSPNPVTGTKRDLGRDYAVCPASGHRIRLTGEPTHLECPGCGYRGEVGWFETG